MNFNLAREPWSDTAATVLTPVCADTPGGLEDIAGQVRRGNASLFRVSSQEKLVGYYVVRIDSLNVGDELVIIAGAGKLPDFDLVAVMLPILEAQAEISGCKSVRIHTNRKGMVNKISRRGFCFSEWVFRKELNK